MIAYTTLISFRTHTLLFTMKSGWATSYFLIVLTPGLSFTRTTRDTRVQDIRMQNVCIRDIPKPAHSLFDSHAENILFSVENSSLCPLKFNCN